MPSTVGIVASGEDVLNDAVFWVDAGRSSVVSGALTNLGTGGSALDARFGSTSGTDSFDPQLLTHTGTNYLYLPGLAGNYASTPDSAALDITGDIEIVCRVNLTDWTPATWNNLVVKRDPTNASYLFRVVTTGRLEFVRWSAAAAVTSQSTAALSFADGSSGWVKVTFDADNGATGNTTRFYYAADQSSEPSSWTQLGSDVVQAGVATIDATIAPLHVGAGQSGTVDPANGKFYRAIVRDGIGGTAVFDADFTTGITSGAQATFTESSANAATVTINRSTSGRKSVAVVRNVLSFGTDDYLEVADSDLLDFGASDSFTVMAVVRMWNTMNSSGAVIAKKTGNGTIGTGWLIRNGAATPTDTAFDTYDGATNTNRTMPTSKTSGTLAVLTGQATATQLFAYYNTTASAGTTRQAGSYANSEVMRVGRLSGASTQYVDMELVAAAVWRRALNTNEIATIVARYT